MQKIGNFLIEKGNTIKEALKKIDKGARKIVFINDEKGKLYAALTDGDIRRWILKTGGIEGRVDDICSKSPVCAKENYSIARVKDLMVTKKIEAIPIVNNNREIVKILFWDDIFSKREKKVEKLSLPVVIMAGGKGARLDPFTRVLPKPLIPIGEKTIIEKIMNEYARFGMTNFYISINHKGKMIKAYFEEHESAYSFNFIEESFPMGTVGSLGLLKGQFKKPFFVSNCDVIIKADYADIYRQHRKNKNVLTMISSMQHYRIPYGICIVEGAGKLKRIKEKPEYDFLVNTGMYLMSPEVLELIPKKKVFNIGDLISKLNEDNYKIGIYPVSEKSWLDIGQWGEYRKNLNNLLK